MTQRQQPVQLAGPVENHVELARDRTGVALNHQESLTVGRNIIALKWSIREQEIRSVKQFVRCANGAVRLDRYGHDCVLGQVEQLLAIARPARQDPSSG